MGVNCAFFSAYSGNPDFFKNGLLVALKSLRLTNPELPVAVLHDGLSTDEKNSLGGCELIRVDASPFRSSHRPDLSAGTYFKFYAGVLSHYEKALYLDSDLVVLDRLDGLFENKGTLLARREKFDLAHDFTDPAKVRSRESMEDTGAFLNGGVLCFDTAFWKKENLLDQALEIAAEYGWDFFRNADQGILNVLAHRTSGFTPLSETYNYLRWPDMMQALAWGESANSRGFRAPERMGRLQQRLAKKGLRGPWTRASHAKIVHWNGPRKPWQLAGSDDRARLHAACYEQFVR